MKLIVSRSGRWIALSLLAAGLLSGHALPARASQVSPAAPIVAGDSCRQELAAGPQMRPIGNCEAALAACMNSGGDSDTCWNAYWRCISR